MNWEQVPLITYQILTGAYMLVGLLSLLTIVIPGLVIIWSGALVYVVVEGLFFGFNWLNLTLLVFITVLMVVGNLLDNLLMGGQARQVGASWWSIGFALLGALVGSIFWPPLGGLAAALVVLFVGEFIRARNVKQAWLATRSMAAGCGWAVAARLLVGLMMMGWWGVMIAAGYLGWV
jgi:uncharacterized protein